MARRRKVDDGGAENGKLRHGRRYTAFSFRNNDVADPKIHLAQLLGAALASVAPAVTPISGWSGRATPRAHGDFASNLAMKLARVLMTIRARSPSACASCPCRRWC
ncbi:MAG: hypothetical protein IPJ52_05900 [Rhodocyclaceae bacterium]|nr:hypothetical protein [Rhodocyclaceae bacterium]